MNATLPPPAAARPASAPTAPAIPVQVPEPREPSLATWTLPVAERMLYDAAISRSGAMTGIRFAKRGNMVTDTGLNVVALDTETGGLSPEAHALLSVTAVAMRDRFTLPHTVYVEPAAGLQVDARAVAVNGLTPDGLASKGAQAERAAMEQLRDILNTMHGGRGVAIAAHRAEFDDGFLRAAEARTGVRLPIVEVLDTHRSCAALRDRWPTSAYAQDRNTLDTFRNICVGRQAARTTHTSVEDTLLLAACLRVMARQELALHITRRADVPVTPT